MAVKGKQEAQQPLILRAHRLMEAFAKSDDERDFYLDRVEGFIVYVDLEKSQGEMDELLQELDKNAERYCMIPKLTFYEAKKIMEGFVNEKVYDIDTKEKLLDIIQSKEARANFLEFIYDHHTELEKWQQYYQERSRIRIIEWLRNNHFHFVFEEDLELSRTLLEKMKRLLFETKIDKEVLAARKTLTAKAKSYYSNEALNPRPKRGRPPKQVAKQEIEPSVTSDIYLTVPTPVRPFLFTPDISSASAVTFSSDFNAQGLFAARRHGHEHETGIENLQQKLAALRQLSANWAQSEAVAQPKIKMKPVVDFEDEEEDEEEDDEEEILTTTSKTSKPLPKLNVPPTPSKKVLPPLRTAPESSKSIEKRSAPTAPPAASKPLRPIIKAGKAAEPSSGMGKKKHKRIIPVQQANANKKPLKKMIGASSTVKKLVKSNVKPASKPVARVPLKRLKTTTKPVISKKSSANEQSAKSKARKK